LLLEVIDCPYFEENWLLLNFTSRYFKTGHCTPRRSRIETWTSRVRNQSALYRRCARYL